MLLALFIVLYLLCGAAVFSALEQPKEREAKARWAQRFEHFSQKHNLSRRDLRNFLRSYEEANVAGIRVDTVRPRWDFTGAFYFVGTVVSTIGEVLQQLSHTGRSFEVNRDDRTVFWVNVCFSTLFLFLLGISTDLSQLLMCRLL